MENETIEETCLKNTEPFSIALLDETLKRTLFGKHIIFKETIGSTNVFLKGLAQKGAVEGTVVIADEQSAGLGRLGRPWFSKKGENLLFSVLLRPKLPAGKIFILTMIFALAGVDAIQKTCGLTAMIKWPNDLYIGQKKIGGILTEFSVLNGAVEYVILGMGLNVNSNPEIKHNLLYETSSLYNERQIRVPREPILCKLLEQLDIYYNRAIGDVKEKEALFKRWNEKSLVLGKTVVLQTGKEPIEGEVTGIDRDGALLLLTGDGMKRKFVSGDVSVKMNFSKEKPLKL